MNQPFRRKKRRGGRPHRRGAPQGKSRRVPTGGPTDHVMPTLHRIAEGQFEFQPPECACDRREDIDEVRNMISGGEQEIARDELLYLVSDCRGFLEAHNLLAELALEEGDIGIARGHFGFGYECCLNALPPGFRGRLSSHRGQNAHFFAAGRGLARCLIAQKKTAEGREVLEFLARLDPTDEVTASLLKELSEREKG
jgi:hypothetical protein